MKKILSLLFASFLIISSMFASNITPDIDWKVGFTIGDPAIKSINSITFGPANILFVGDALSAQVVAVDLSDKMSKTTNDVQMIKNVDGHLAKMLGTTKDQISITDMAVNPGSQDVFLSVQHGSGKNMLFKVIGDAFEMVKLDHVSHSKMAIAEPISADAKDRRDRSLRKWAISDLRYDDGKVFLTGLSNKEFGSTFRSMDFPFKDDQSFGSLEIYHAAHGKYETNSPVKTFTTVTLNGEPHVIASYTCTPLVIFPLKDLKNGVHAKGRTVAELGNRNTPLDIIEIKSEGERFILLANSSRSLMRIKVSDIEAFKDDLTSPVKENSATAGVDFIALPLVNVLQLDKLSDDSFVMLQRTSSGDLVLNKGGKRWL